MKTRKTFKSITAMLLALILSLGSMTSAFAVNVGEIIDWPATEEYEYTDEYIYKGELSEGSNPIKEEIEDYWVGGCYTFEVKKAGYYLFTYGYDLALSISEETVDGKPRNYAATVNASTGEGDAFEKNLVAYLTESTVYVGINYNSNPIDDEIVIEYIGEELVDIEIDESKLQNLVMDYDFGYGSGRGFDLQRDITLVFADGSEKTVEGAYIRFEAEGDGGEAVEGENTVTTMNTFGVEKQYTMTCISLDDVIEKIEISNLDKYLKAYRYYNPGDIEYSFNGSEDDENGIQGETLTVTFTDGTKQSFVINWEEEIAIKLESGEEVYIFVANNYHYEDDKAYLEIETFNGDILLKEECEIIEASDKQNLERLGENLSYAFSWLAWDFEYWIGVIMNPAEYPYYSTGEALLNLVEELFSDIDRIFSEIRDCCGHLVLG